MKQVSNAFGFNRAKQFLTSWGVALVMGMPAIAMAQLPEMEAPSQGGGGLISTLQGYLYDFGALIGLVLCTIAFLMVGASAVASFKEARERETWGKFAVTVVVGVVLIVAIIWLATEALPILSQ
ncbi:TIGR03745 family integrating conjugative element membrane protein [Vreelandella nigrificans]|uniref:TIGR03745 family integrating conjugative element membrane protein n=1 Tax=Vreelandella nigrificans TaxID=2042704 RepID=A0A2A4HFU5_9GAMM|nr:TIGR03745 family integrating conjugative element membrane protein [Halomonas nigrificans]PCF94078.1 TIGR03745 family integrating conjugative element membrane protein [Halomonas nigrificans]